ncbi:MAG: VOC family protein [Flavobacteriales bacterium]|nr:VOC family protein [Flavobacteriales bacterium]
MKEHLHALAWFEIPANDFERARKFYSTIFAFDMPEMTFGPVRMGFFLHDREAGGIGGAIVHNPEFYVPSGDGAKVYLNGGHDLSVVLDRVEGAGGEVLIPKRAIGEGMGHMGMFRDSEGNVVALHSPE